MKNILLFFTLFAVCTGGSFAMSFKSSQKTHTSVYPTINFRNAVITDSAEQNGITITKGYVLFRAFRTHFRIVGDLNSSKPPLLLLHGGPGSTHNYFEVMDHLAAQTGRLLISYDQLGCGESFLENRPELWVADTWVDELDNLIKKLELKKIHILGQSWGGMLAITYLADRTQKGIVSVILSSALSDSQLWGAEQHRMARQLPPAEQQALAQAEQTNDYTSPQYLQAIGHYMQLHGSDQKYTDDAPECLRRKKRFGEESYLVAWGPNELTPLGTLAHWNYTEKLPRITVPALIISGTEDLSTPTIAKTMADKFPNATWELIEKCRHLCFVDMPEPYFKKLTSWLANTDNKK